MTAWNKVSVGQIVPINLVDAITGIGDTLVETLTSARAKLNLASNIPNIPDVQGTGVAVANAILDTIEGILKGGRIHVIAIPISKRTEVPNLPSTLDDLQAALDVDLGQLPQAVNKAYATIVARSGGNAGFYNAFAESLLDQGDPNRPQYDQSSDAVVMLTIMTGAPTLSGTLEAATALEHLIRPNNSTTSLSARTIPIPQDLRAKVVSAATGKGIGVQLAWQPPETSYLLRFIPGAAITVKRYVVIRSTNAKLQSEPTVASLFGTTNIHEGMVVSDFKVLAIGSWKNASFLDTTADVSISAPYYYCVAWECEVRENGQTTTVPFGKLSNVVKAAVTVPTPAQTGRAPNWYATPSPIAAFPAFASAAQRMLSETRVILTPSTNPASRINAAINLLTDHIERASTASTALIADISKISKLLQAATASFYVTQFAGIGGNARLLTELATRLNDVTDESRPPFDSTEYVCGFCLVAGASRITDLAPVIDFFNMLFGPATTTNPLLGVLASIDTLVTQAEATVFGDNMRPINTDIVTDMTTTTAPSVVIAEDGTVVTTDSAKNPEAGQTNVIPTSELC